MSARIDVDGATLRYDERGSGPPLVLLHGGLGSGAVWEPVATRLAGEFRVITPDSRGHGRSTNSGATLSYALLADDVAAFSRALGLHKPVIAGWSDGGQIAMELAVRHPEVAGALIIGGAYPEFVHSGLHDAHRDLLANLEEQLGDEAEEIKALHDDWDELVKQSEAMWLSYEGLSDDEISKITTPVLVLAGDRDELVGLDLSIALYRRFAEAELAICPAASHESPMTNERADVFAAVIGDFCRRHDTRHVAAGPPSEVA